MSRSESAAHREHCAEHIRGHLPLRVGVRGPFEAHVLASGGRISLKCRGVEHDLSRRLSLPDSRIQF